ncbi:SRPBCC domain-containing protein [Dactylosporangium roseum]|uniref:SRPBCC domain-containing protein n=1 Tax=Dactylosporangium roseum TaxID=47989 RepID=A0ABY5ZGR0_9ACTN|nr:SRPBCC domain-containing protein [Dactylosporangium roseum]UWZ39903.1 SRPBCC domain-containing protein [Dactylosporangium roseum]
MVMTGELGVTTFELPSDEEVRIVRTVAAPRGLVFDVHTRAEHLPKWMVGPPGWTMPVCEIDLRPGGRFRYVWRSAGDEELTIAGTFHEVIRPDRLVSSEAWSGDWPETRNTVTFAEHDGRTTITTTIRHVSQEARDAALQSGMKDGLDAGHARLEAYLATVEPAVAMPAMRLELVPVPVADVDAALAFYEGRLGFTVDHDVRPGNGSRVTQLTPPGSSCSIVLYKDLPGLDLPPGTLRGLHLVVDDIHKSREALLARGVEVAGVDDLGGILYAAFADPDGNTWLLQEIPRGSSRPAD